MQTLPAQRVSGLRPGTIKITRTAALQPATPLSAPIRRKQQRLLTVTQTVAHVQVPVRAGFYGARDNKPPSRPGSGPNWLDENADKKAGPPAGGGLGAGHSDADISSRTAVSLRNLAVVSFWTQLSLSVVSGVILFFAIQSTAAPGRAPNVSVWFTLVGVIFSFFSTFLAQGLRRRAFSILERGEAIATGKVVSSLLTNININLIGLGATIVGLQSTVGTLVAKTLTTASSNPYAGNPTTRAGAPAALDAFSIQASTNTVLAHFASIVFANWLLRLLQRSQQNAAAA